MKNKLTKLFKHKVLLVTVLRSVRYYSLADGFCLITIIIIIIAQISIAPFKGLKDALHEGKTGNIQTEQTKQNK